MVRPERERMDPGHRLWHYREHAAEDNLEVQASSEWPIIFGDDANSSHWKPPIPFATRKIATRPRERQRRRFPSTRYTQKT